MSPISRCACLVLLLQIGISNAVIQENNWWNGTVIYEIFPMSFRDSNNDGYGDLKGIEEKLQYLDKQLGINTILLRPIYPTSKDMTDGKFKYDVLDYKDIYNKYGTFEDFEHLMAQAKNRSMKVILDFIPNHTSENHEWFKKSSIKDPQEKYKNMYVWRDGPDPEKPPNNWKAVGTNDSAWVHVKEKGQFYLSQFGDGQCDLNYTSKEVLTEIDSILKYWLDKGVDGFRMDKVSYLYENDDFKDEGSDRDKTKNDPRNQILIQRWREVLDEWRRENDANGTEKILLTDVDETQASLFYKNGSHIPINYNLTALKSDSKAVDFKKAIEGWLNSVPKGHVANWMVSDYDHHRVAEIFKDGTNEEERGRADQMTMLTMILPGIAFTYSGEEIGMTDKDKFSQRSVFQWNNNSDHAGFCDSCNNTYDWTKPNKDNSATRNVEMEQNDTNSFLTHYISLVKLRNKSTQSAILANGTCKVYNSTDKTLVVVRQLEDESVVLVMNFDGNNQTVNLGTWVPDVKDATVLMSSINYKGNLGEGTKLDPSKIELKMLGALLLFTKSGGITTMASALLLFGCSLFSLSRAFHL